LIPAALLLTACAGDATFVQRGGAAPDARQLEADASACRSFWPLVGGVFGGALYGAAEGAAIGAASGGADVGAIAGAGAGGVIGLFAGAVTSATGDGYERCMADKDYVRGVATPAAAPRRDARPAIEEPAR
jgi:hypothetical protein